MNTTKEVFIMNNKINKHYNWNSLIPEWKSSGLTVSDFCKKHEIRCNAMYAALKRRCISSNNSSDSTLKESDQLFIPVAVSEETSHSYSSITINIGKANIIIDEGFNKSVLQDVISILSKVC